MDKTLLEKLIDKAMHDEAFRHALFADPQSVLAEHGFTPEEIAKLEELFEQGVPLEELGERISKYLFGGAGPGG